jgi:hypothetical protein
MHNKDDQIAHRTILAVSRGPRTTREFSNSPWTGEPDAAGACPFQDLELMAQRENLKLQRSSIAE